MSAAYSQSLSVRLQVDSSCMCNGISSVFWRVVNNCETPDAPHQDGFMDWDVWAKNFINYESQVQLSVNAAMDDKGYLIVVRAAFTVAFTKDSHLLRLDTFRDLLLRDNGLLSVCVAQALLEARSTVDELVRETLRSLLGGSLSENQAKCQDCSMRISRCLLKHIVEYVLVKPLVMPTGFRFTEHAAIAQKRLEFQAEIDRFSAAHAAITAIEQKFDHDSWADDAATALLSFREAGGDPELSASRDAASHPAAL